MFRNQFVWNTMNTIQLQLLPDEMASSTDLTYNGWRSIQSSSEPGDTVHAKAKRSDSITSWNSITWEALSPSIGTPVNFSGQLTLASTDPIRSSLANQSSVSVRTSSVADGKQSLDNSALPPLMASAPSSASGVIIDRNWKSEIKSMLKIPLPTGNMPLAQSLTSSSSPHGTVLQNRSVRTQQDHLTTLKRGSIRGLQSILGAQGYSPYSGGSSKDGRASPALSFATLNEREDSDHSLRSDTSPTTDISITDEELALLGPPWAKKGMLCQKQYWECTGKRAKSKTWMDVTGWGAPVSSVAETG
ncbi:hypothetical protein BD311DRAFT_822270 [Dichomitus squalens]|uniref:Uncharacterized protein n=1 Tax=Dichomitus squalens TaxID=114155 RepID=A0A4Q9M8R6_9APHY|nr:hypothetical protein BD311DRAFT_822270 [Dichomitus squalens]